MIRQPNDLISYRTLVQRRLATNPDNDADKLLDRVFGEFRDFAEAYDKHFTEIDGRGQSRLDKLSKRLKVRKKRLEFRKNRAIEDYFHVLGRVAEQRQVDHYRAILDAGTEEAKKYLARLPIKLPGVLLYFEKVALIKHVPYTNIPIIGIPYDLVAREERDWMAIPHEIGHYFYWHADRLETDSETWHLGNLAHARSSQAEIKELAEQTIDEHIHDKPEWSVVRNVILGWLEEIIADIIGTRLAGAEFAHSFKKIISNQAGNIESLKLNDGSHPPMFLRPLIRNKVLTLLNADERPDWEHFFNIEFGIRRLNSHKITLLENIFDNDDLNDSISLRDFLFRLASIEAIDLDEKKTLRDFLRAFSGESFQHRQVRLTLSQILKILMPVVERLNNRIVEYIDHLNAISQGENHLQRDAGFVQLLEAAQQVSDKNGKPVDQILLRPSIVETGEQHSHNLWGWHGVKWIRHYRNYTHDSALGT